MKHLTDEGGKFSDEKLHIEGGKKPSRCCQESSAKSFTGNGIHVFYCFLPKFTIISKDTISNTGKGGSGVTLKRVTYMKYYVKHIWLGSRQICI